MKLFKRLLLIAPLLSTFITFSQENSNQHIPELVFKNPVRISGQEGKDGAVYRFNDVADGIDATIEILRRSSQSVVLSNIDVSNQGWDKAFQPQIGIPGWVAPGQTWWMEFEMKFLKAGTNTKKKIQSFNVTALDVDGDGAYIREFVQMNKVESVKNSPISYLLQGLPLSLPDLLGGLLSGLNLSGNDIKIEGPTMNFTGIDTAGTAVMSTFSYEQKDQIRFIMGGNSSGWWSTAGERMNSLWFKSFDLEPQGVLPVTFHSFTALLEKNNVILDWVVDTDDDFSHYVVERSTDGKNYNEIGVVFTTGTINEISRYQFKDINVTTNSGIVYYRLRWEERTRETLYSHVRIVRIGQDKENMEMTTYPNPVRDQLRVTFPSSWQGKNVNLEVYSGSGSKVFAMSVENASQTEIMNLSTLPKGFYLIKASSDNQIARQRIIKD